jgi:hypothetical protein
MVLAYYKNVSTWGITMVRYSQGFITVLLIASPDGFKLMLVK